MTDPSSKGDAGGVPFDTDALFGGSARLGLLLGALELPWERVAPFVAAFPGELAAYQELSVSSGRADLGLMTRGNGIDFTHRVTHFMEAHGIDEPALRRLLVTARYFEHANLFFKVEVGASGIEEMSWYVRRRPDTAVARAWLESGGVGTAGLDLFDAVASTLEKRTVHFLATSQRPGAEPVVKVYFSQPDSAESWRRIEAAVQLTGVERADWAPLSERFSDLARHTTFVSIAFCGGRAVPGAKVDIHDLDPRVVKGMAGLGSKGEPPENNAAGRIDLLLQVMRRERVDYAGFRFVPGESMSVRVYATRG